MHRFVLLVAGLMAAMGHLQVRAATFASEYELLRKLPPGLVARLSPGRPGTNGLIGFHQRQGRWFEAGMQRGGCWMLIGAVVAGDRAAADEAWRSVEVTFEHQLADGGFQSEPKPEATHPPTLPERVETAFFYLQELGHAILVVQASPMEPHFRDRIAALRPGIRRACDFIQSGYDGIIRKAGHTANRMFIAAKAFGLCGILLDDPALKESSRKLVAVAMAKRDAEGVFIESGGRDSSYNAVSLLMAGVLNLYLQDRELDAAMVKAMAWERTRILPTGEVRVDGNTRTGVGKEVFMGQPKNVNYREVALALCYHGMVHDDPSAVALAEKVFAWPGPTGR